MFSFVDNLIVSVYPSPNLEISKYLNIPTNYEILLGLSRQSNGWSESF